MSLDTITGGMRALLNNDEITSYERTVLNSMLDQATRRGRLSEKQVKFYESIASNYTENALADKREWEATFVDKKLEDLRIVARYYKKQGTYFLALAEKILSDEGYIPNHSQYRKLCENKYAQKVLAAHNDKPKYEQGQLVTFRSSAGAAERRCGDGYLKPTVPMMVIAVDAAPVTSAARGAKKYKLLPVGKAETLIVEERHIMKARKLGSTKK